MADNGHPAMSQEPVASAAAAAAVVASSRAEEPPDLSRSHPPTSPACWDSKLVFLTSGVVTPSLNPSSLCQQGFLVQFIREIPESTDHAGSPPFLVSSIITFTVNMSLSSGWAGDGWSMPLPFQASVYWHSDDQVHPLLVTITTHRLISMKLEISYSFCANVIRFFFSDNNMVIYICLIITDQHSSKNIFV